MCMIITDYSIFFQDDLLFAVKSLYIHIEIYSLTPYLYLEANQLSSNITSH